MEGWKLFNKQDTVSGKIMFHYVTMSLHVFSFGFNLKLTEKMHKFIGARIIMFFNDVDVCEGPASPYHGQSVELKAVFLSRAHYHKEYGRSWCNSQWVNTLFPVENKAETGNETKTGH